MHWNEREGNRVESGLLCYIWIELSSHIDQVVRNKTDLSNEDMRVFTNIETVIIILLKWLLNIADDCSLL